MSLAVAILAGGRATRLGAIADDVPKALMDVAGRPFIAHQLEILRRNGIGDAVICTGYLGQLIEDAVGDGSRWGMAVRYARDGAQPLGTGGALRRALPLLGTSFFVLYGDSYLDCDYRLVERTFLRSGCRGLMTVFRNDGRWDASNVQFESGRIVRYDKRNRDSHMHHIDYGLGVLTAAAFAGYPEDGTLDLATVYQDLVAVGDLAACEVPERFFEIGTPESLAELRQHLAAAKSHP